MTPYQRAQTQARAASPYRDYEIGSPEEGAHANWVLGCIPALLGYPDDVLRYAALTPVGAEENDCTRYAEQGYRAGRVAAAAQPVAAG